MFPVRRISGQLRSRVATRERNRVLRANAPAFDMSSRMRATICLLALTGMIQPAVALDSAEWRKQSVYQASHDAKLECSSVAYMPTIQVMTDRFARTDGRSVDCDLGKNRYCGGTWQGLSEREYR